MEQLSSPTLAAATRTNTSSIANTDIWQRLWLGIAVPGPAQNKIAASFQDYPHYIERAIPRDRWHVTLLWLGEVKNPQQYFSRLMQPLTTSYILTVRITHVGRGLNKHQLWAYADPSVVLRTLREEFIKRLKRMRYHFAGADHRDDFIPHVTVAKLFRMSGRVGLADSAINVSWPISAIHLVRSESAPEGTIYHIERTASIHA